MLQILTRLVFEAEGKIAHLYLDNDTPLSAVKDMLLQGLRYVGNIEEQVKAAAAKAQEEAKANEAVAIAEEPKAEEPVQQ